MKNINIKERIQELEMDGEANYSSFYLVSYEKDNLEEPTEVLPIENGSKDMSFEGRISLLTDRDGNVLKTFYSDSVSILLVDKDDIVIEEDKEELQKIGPKLVIDKISRYSINHFKHSLHEEEVLYDSKDNFWCEIELPKTHSNLLLIRKSNKEGRTARLYSLDRKEYVTPLFYDLETVVNDGKTIFKYKDYIKSNETINDKPLVSHIEGFIDKNGRFGDQVYFDYTNEVRDVSLNEHAEFLQYYALKRYFASELDNAVDNQIEKIHSRNNKMRLMQHRFVSTINKKTANNC